MTDVIAVLRARGMDATLEYPGQICVRGRHFGTVNPTWGWSTADGRESGDLAIPSDSTDVQAIADAIYTSVTKYVVIWGAGEVEQNRDSFDTLDQVRGMLTFDSDMTTETIESLIAHGQIGDDSDSCACTQFDSPWVRLEKPVRP